MKAVVYKRKGVFAVEEVKTPEPGPGEVLCKVTYCGICGTDLHNFASGIAGAGSIMGHEWGGVVAGLGEGVADLKAGDRVMLYMCPSSRQSASELRIDPRGKYSTPSKGAFAEYCVIPAKNLMRVPDEITDKAAACIEPLVAALHTVRLGNLKRADSVAFIGAGPIALCMIQWVRQLHVSAVYVSEINKPRAAKAAELGADRVFDPLRQDFVSEIVELTDGKGPDIVFECAGGKSTINQACKLVARNGRVICLAVYQEPIMLEPIDWYMMQPEIKFTTNLDSSRQDWELAAKALRTHTVDVESLITKVVSLHEVQGAFQSLLNPKTNQMIRVLVKP